MQKWSLLVVYKRKGKFFFNVGTIFFYYFYTLTMATISFKFVQRPWWYGPRSCGKIVVCLWQVVHRATRPFWGDFATNVVCRGNLRKKEQKGKNLGGGGTFVVVTPNISVVYHCNAFARRILGRTLHQFVAKRRESQIGCDILHFVAIFGGIRRAVLRGERCGDVCSDHCNILDDLGTAKGGIFGTTFCGPFWGTPDQVVLSQKKIFFRD